MAKMVSLKRSAADKKAHENEMAPTGPGGEDYPYGTRLDLDHEALKKHGLHEGPLPKTGDKFDLGGVRGHVHSIEEHTTNGETRRHMTLQATHLTQGLGLSGGDGDGEGDGVRADLEKAVAKSERK